MKIPNCAFQTSPHAGANIVRGFTRLHRSLVVQGAQKSFAMWMLPIFQESDDERLIVKWSSLEDEAPEGLAGANNCKRSCISANGACDSRDVQHVCEERLGIGNGE